MAIELAERPVGETDFGRLCCWSTVPDVIPIGKLEVSSGQLIHGEIRHGGAGLETSREVVRQESFVLGFALLSAKATQIEVFAVEGNDRSARWPMVTHSRNARDLRHSLSDLNPVITGLGDLERPLCLVTDR
jgi:hypothetical protein